MINIKYIWDVSVDIQNATLHMKRVKKPHIFLATINGKVVKNKRYRDQSKKIILL